MQVSDIISARSVDSIDAAVAIMTAIDGRLADDDGLKWFNRLYLRVTESVRAAVQESAFRDPAFMALLDVVFARQYFEAIVAAERGTAAAPSAWRPLLEARHAPGITRIRFAIAGMNAHINRDLPDGIVQCFASLGGDPLTASAREQDFDGINDLLERVEQQVKGEFSVGAIATLDRLGGEADDAVAMWKIRKARATAWTNAKVLWTLRRLPRLRDEFFGHLDSLVGLGSRTLLLPRIAPVPGGPR